MLLKLNKIKNCISESLGEEHYFRLRQHNTQSFWLSIILSAALVISLWYAGVNAQHIGIWVTVLLVANGIRFSLNVYKKHNISGFNHNAWICQYILLTTLISAIWGSAGIMLYPNDALIQMVLLVLLLSVLVSTAPLMMASRSAFHAQFVAILVPISTSMLLNYSETGYVLLITALFSLTLTILVASHYIHQVILELKDTQEELKLQADTDQLTQIPNRRSFERSFKTEWRRSGREKQPISLLIVDIDDFKQYNDSFGHQAGDYCLKQIAQVINTAAQRPGDIPARIGGEEFAVLLPNTDKEGAMTVAERLRTQVNRLMIPRHAEKEGNISVSIGVSSCAPISIDGNSDLENLKTDVVYPAMLMKSADHALYQAKNSGKDQIVCEDCGMHSVHESLKKTPDATLDADNTLTTS